MVLLVGRRKCGTSELKGRNEDNRGEHMGAAPNQDLSIASGGLGALGANEVRLVGYLVVLNDE